MLVMKKNITDECAKDLSISSYKWAYRVRLDHPVKTYLEEIPRENTVVFVDENVLFAHNWLKPVLERHDTVVLAATESLKSFNGVEEIIRSLFSRKINKNTCLYVVGGGVLQEAIGFTASIFFRGLNWCFVPTTLLAQADSCIGSKTSLNFDSGKNQLGTFHPPIDICIDPIFLKSLPEEHYRSGLGEIFHYLLVSGEKDFEFGATSLDGVLHDRSKTSSMIERSLMIKKEMIEVDEFDGGPRRVFNYGHSFGHAIEAATGFSIPHGIAVSIGMDVANMLSVHKGLVAPTFRNRVRRALIKIWGENTLAPSMVERFVDALSRDKKNEQGEVKVILTKGFGEMFLTSLDIDSSTQTLLNDYFEDRLQWRDI